MAYMIPTIPDGEIGDIPSLIFGPDHWLQERYDDPEVQGGKIALIAAKQIRVQKPPSFLDHMQSRYLKQVAYNDRIIQSEKEIAAINADIPEFLSQMNLDPNDQVVIVTNGSEEMKRDEEAFAGQLWMQSDRHMTAANPVIKGDPRSREAAILSAVYEAVSWRHSLENSIQGPRKGQRVVIYPKEITGLPQMLTSRNVVVDDDVEDHSELYAAILAESDQFECPPLFMREDCDQLTSHPVWATKIKEWMITAARVATGSRRRVLEDGPDVMNSDDEDSKKEEHGDKLTGMYANGCSSFDQARLTEQQAQAQRASATFSGSMSLPAPEPERKPTPLTSPVNSDDEGGMSENQCRWVNLGNKMANRAVKSSVALLSAPPRPAIRIPLPTDSDPEIQAPSKATPVEIVQAAPTPATDTSTRVKKTADSPRAQTDQPTGAKAPAPTKGQAKGQESPETKVSTPMRTRRQAKQQQEDGSGAGGFRGVAVVRCSQVPRRGQTK
jgi:hypothetical protein